MYKAPPFGPTNSNLPQQQQHYTNFSEQQIPTMPQPHLMPTPSTTRWNIDHMPWKQDTNNLSSAQPGGIMQFNALGNIFTEKSGKDQLHKKRKSLLPSSIPTKQFISEEKITAHFNGLHISGDASQTTNTTFENEMNQELSNIYFQNNSKKLEEQLKNAKRITLCENLLKFNDPQRTNILPEVLLNRIVEPCTAVVLWRPPPPQLEKLHATITQKQQSLIENQTPDRPPLLNICRIENEELMISPDEEIDDFVNNNNTCNIDFNNFNSESMDQDI